jgi:hypothetical protein
MEQSDIQVILGILTNEIIEYFFREDDPIRIQKILLAIRKNCKRLPKENTKENLKTLGHSLGLTLNLHVQSPDEIRTFRNRLRDLVPYLTINSVPKLEAFISGIAEALQTPIELLMISLRADTWIERTGKPYNVSPDILPDGLL